MEKYILKILIVVFIILIITYFYISEQRQPNIISPSKLTKQEQLELKVEELKEENDRLKDELCHTSSQLDELESDYSDAEDLIKILQEQLEDYGIEPYTL